MVVYHFVSIPILSEIKFYHCYIIVPNQWAILPTFVLCICCPVFFLQRFTASESSLDINDQTVVYIAANIVVVVVLGLFWRFLVVLDVSWCFMMFLLLLSVRSNAPVAGWYWCQAEWLYTAFSRALTHQRVRSGKTQHRWQKKRVGESAVWNAKMVDMVLQLYGILC